MIVSFLLAAVVYTATPGSAVQVKIPASGSLRSVEVMWQNKKVPAFQVNDLWATILGVDLDAKPGQQQAVALLTMDDGRVDRREIAINIVAKRFPTHHLKVAERFTSLSKADLDRVNRETREIVATFAPITTEVVPDEVFTVPIPSGSGRNFGERRVFNGKPRAPHSGSDLRAATGTPVHATNRGRVVLAKAHFFAGNTVILDHGLGIYSLYAHLSRMDVKKGDLVRNGQAVGLVGATGRVTGPHLHWAMKVQGARVDPFSLVGLGFSGR